jgi:DNA-binding response OmpR family regulator
MHAQSILVVDDDSDIIELIRYNLEKEGYRTFFAYDGNDALGILNDECIDLAVLDIGLPGFSGMDICRRMKKDERLKSIPVIFATARTQEADILVGFQAGAEDYLRKPFSPKELVARVHSLLRRTQHTGQDYRLRDFEVSFDRHLVKIAGERVSLTHREFGVLQILITGNGRTASRHQILERVWGMDARSSPRSVDIVITRIREKIKPYHACIRTITGVGYQWDTEEQGAN